MRADVGDHRRTAAVKTICRWRWGEKTGRLAMALWIPRETAPTVSVAPLTQLPLCNAPKTQGIAVTIWPISPRIASGHSSGSRRASTWRSPYHILSR